MSVLGIKSSLKKLKKEAQTKKKKPRVWNQLLGILAKEQFALAKKEHKTDKLNHQQRSESWAAAVKEAKERYRAISDSNKSKRSAQKMRGAELRRERAVIKFDKEVSKSKEELYSVAEQYSLRRHEEMAKTIDGLKKENLQIKKELAVKEEKTGETTTTTTTTTPVKGEIPPLEMPPLETEGARSGATTKPQSSSLSLALPSSQSFLGRSRRLGAAESSRAKRPKIATGPKV